MFQVFPKTSVQSDSSFFVSFPFFDGPARQTDVHVFLKPASFFHPSSPQADQRQDKPGSLVICYVLTYWPALFTYFHFECFVYISARLQLSDNLSIEMHCGDCSRAALL